MTDQGQPRPRPVEVELMKGGPALPVETRILADVWLALGILFMLAAAYFGFSALNALGHARSQIEQPPGPAPTATGACVDGRDILTGEPC